MQAARNLAALTRRREGLLACVCGGDANDAQVAEAKVQLAGAWALAVLCVGSHLGHHLHHLGIHQYAHSDLLNVAGQPWVGTALAAAALLGPGRELIAEGFQVRPRLGDAGDG